MKKRTLIVATMAVAMAAFVGCSKDFDFVAAPEQGNAGLDQRPEVGSPALTFGVDTRATVMDAEGDNISWKYEVNDQVGAMLVDRTITEEEAVTLYVKKSSDYLSADWTYADYFAGFKAYSDDAKYNFSSALDKVEVDGEEAYVPASSERFYVITNDEIWTNYPYKTEDAEKFKTPATLVEGHYMFYAPYSERNGKRGPLSAYLPGVQEVGETGTDAVNTFYGNKNGNPVWLGMSYLSAAETSSVNPEIGHIFAYPKFTIANHFEGYLFDGDVLATGKELGGTSDNKYFISTTDEVATYTMTVKEIEFYTNKENGFAYERVIKPETLAEVKDWAGGAEYKTTYTDEVAVPVEGSASFDNKGKVKFDNGLAIEKSKEQQRIAVTVNKELPFGEKFSFYVVMPAADYTEDGLFARVLVTIGDKDYYIITNDVTGNTYNEDGVVKGLQLSNKEDAKYYGHAYVSAGTGFIEVNDYQIIDRGDRGSDKIELVRGQRWPAAEVNLDKTLKSFKGELLTIDLVGGMSQVAVAAETEKTVVDNGIKNTQDLIDFLGKAHRAAAVKEVANAAAVKNTNTDFYFVKDNNETTISAELVKQLENRLPVGSFTLMTNLPIEADVMVAAGEESDEYVFTAGEASYTIAYDNTTFGAAAGSLVDGINILEASGELKMKSDNTMAVVFANDGATVKNPAGINGIVVAGGKTLTVNATADVAAWIVAGEEAIIDIQAGSKGLTNPNNDFTEATVNNQALATVAGEVGVVKYSRNGFGTEPIPAATNVNYVIINAASSSAKLPVETATFDYVKNLKNVTIEFGTNISTLESAGETVTLGDHIKNVKGTNTVTWNTTDEIIGTTVSHKADVFALTQGNGVTFIKRQ